MARILLGVTGSVAAIKTPELFQALVREGHEVKVVATQAATYFFDPEEIGRRNVYLDDDEWPGRAQGRRYQREDPVLHIELRRWAEILLVAPLDANTLAKLACGLCDNCLTCVWRAWDLQRRVVLAPAMNTLMWEHPLTVEHLTRLTGDGVPRRLPVEELLGWINSHCDNLKIVPPESRKLACGDVGVGAMAAITAIVQAVGKMQSAQEIEHGS